MNKVVEAVDFLLDHFDIERTLDNNNQMLLFMECVAIYAERSRAYGQVWKQYGALSNLLSVARKTDRLMAVWWTEEEEAYKDGAAVPRLHKDNLDDAFDLINYAAFFIRNARAANFTGTTPKRPE